MNYGNVTKVLGILLKIKAVLMVPSFLVAVYYGHRSDILSFSVSIVLVLICGLLISLIKSDNSKINAKEGLSIVAIGWIMVSFFGSLPFIISGSIPSFTNAFFESVSGFTTTGASILTEIESLPKGILFWRSFTHWIGGMGILVFTVSLLPTLGIGGMQIYKAESPGPVKGKILPRIKDTAGILYKTYLIITAAEILLLFIGGMNLYEACIHTFGTVGTGGFSSKNTSVAAFNSTYIHVVITVFMMLAGINFNLYYALFKGKWKDIYKDEELRLYLGVIFTATVMICFDLFFRSYGKFGMSLRDAYFQVTSIMTTTGYATADFDRWSTFAKAILFVLMFMGGCAGSTAGGIKSIRILILFKLVKREIAKIFHPRAVISIKVGGNPVSDDTISAIMSFVLLYIIIFLLGTIIVSLEGIGLVSSLSSVAATLSNIGPGFEVIGPTQSYNEFSSISKWIFSLFMLLGRLEFFTIIALLAPKSWKNE